LRNGQAVINASSGSTAISEAWFAQRLGLPFIAVMPRSTAIAKQREIAELGGRCELLEPGVDPAIRAQALAREIDGCYLDQFGLASSATDWRGNNNIAQSIMQQCRDLDAGDPAWIVCGAGTGGTSATIGRYLRYVGSAARLCVADPTGGAFAHGWRSGNRNSVATHSTCIEGIGRSHVEPCFAFELAESVLEVEDTASIAGAWLLDRWLGQRYGGSSGTNLVAALQLASDMKAREERGNIVLLLCDRGERYADTLFEPSWLDAQGYTLLPWLTSLEQSALDGCIAGDSKVSMVRPATLEVPAMMGSVSIH
jgi:cysteine synthase A